ncbi:MAG: preprotein translocase subunit SecA [Bacteroidales bacterium]|nr:preprotein translocase subunit SecA [Bacteroidales bacterium]
MNLVTNVITKLFGSKSDRDIKEIMPIVEDTKKIYATLQSISSDELRLKTVKLKERIQEALKPYHLEIEKLKESSDKETVISKKEAIYDQIDKIEKDIDDEVEKVLNDILPEAFAIIKETARRFTEDEHIEVTANDFDRDLAASYDNIEIKNDKARYLNKWIAGGTEITWNMIHYDVQLIGGVALHKGKIAEMATGEGKTLVATLPVFLNALTGRGVHIVTVNNYLAKRDAEWMGTLYQFHGLSVDCIDKHEPNSSERRKAYAADITFGTNNEFGFDYLRDNMAGNPEDLVQRKHNFAIVDEVDSVLIDDARTPLIISGPIPRGEHHEFDEFKPRVEKLVSAQKKMVTELLAEAKRLINAGKKDDGGFKLLQAFKGLPKNKALIKFLSEEGNKSLLLKTENIYLQDNQKNMHKVTDDLFFVIDEKLNSVDLTDKGVDTMTTSTEDSKFFILPDIGSELAELDKLSLGEDELLAKKDKLTQDYAVKSERIHTVNQLLKAYTMFEKDTEYVVIDNKVKIVDEQTGRIMEGRRYSDGLHQAIEAKERVKVEAATQTYATITLQNYFRMYHKLAGMTGTAETEAGELWDIYKLDVVVIPTNRPIVRDDREDLIYRTKREKYNAVIDEVDTLVKDGRPVLVGTTSVEISELLSRMLKMRGIKHNVLNAKLHQKEADIVAEAGRAGTVTIATNMAGRGTDIKLTPEVKDAGGLAIIGTERHESRRVDRQLRGRAGRQGDPGSSQFYVSLEDDLMRLFGSDRIASLMDRLGLEEGEVIQHSMITKSIERAQKKVEENNFGIRKRLLEYDDVMNSQREVIYKKRRHALFGERIQVDVANMMYDVCESVVSELHGNVEFEEFKFELLRHLTISVPFDEKEYMALNSNEITEKLYKVARDNYQRKTENIRKQATPVIKDVYEHQAKAYENILVPITDGNKTYNIVTNLEKSYESECIELIRSYEKSISLYSIDDSWKEHLRELDDLKQAVQNATYEQKDPLLIYKFESFELFKTMIDKVNKEVVGILMKGQLPLRDPSQVKEGEARRKTNMDQLKASKSDVGSAYSNRGGQEGQPQENREARKAQPVRVEKKVGRNDPCPCGSGKKYKNCHGKVNAPA